MKNDCYEIGTIQAFLDGELQAERAERVVKHISLCTECALLMADIQDEGAAAFAALDDELNVLVPTQRLRGKLFAAIDELKRQEKTGWVEKMKSYLGPFLEIDLRSPGIAALVCTLLFVGSFAIGLKVFPPLSSIPDVAVDRGSDIDFSNVRSAPVIESVESDSKPSENNSLSETNVPGVNVVRASNRRSPRRKARRVVQPSVSRDVIPQRAVPAVAGEDIYVQTISSLSQNIVQNKDDLLRPRERVDFEKNLAMVDHAINRMKQEVRKNPGNMAAKDLLKASYQNKIDLLNAVSEKNDLMASIQ